MAQVPPVQPVEADADGPASDVFVSYKAEDRPRVQQLVRALQNDGHRVWWDAHIGTGSEWREEIQAHLDAAGCVVVVWSARSVGPEGRFVRDEATRAQRRGVYTPVSLDPVELPLGFGEQQAISLVGWRGDRRDPRYQTLLAAVRARLAGEPPPRPMELAPPLLSRRAAIAGGAAAAAVAGLGAWTLFSPIAGKGSKRIAVMPFANLSGDPTQAYFSEGIAEEVRGSLSRVGLQVIGRTSSDALREVDATQAAEKLGVGNIVTGSVRRSADALRISAQLVDGKDGVERWGQSYDRAAGDTITIQADIAANVAAQLSIALGMAKRSALTLGGTSDGTAHDLFLKADAARRGGDSAETFRAIVGLLESAIARDPNYADAYLGKADALSVLATDFPESPADGAAKLELAKRAAAKAVALAPQLGGGYAMLGKIAADSLQFPEALSMSRKAVSASPNSPAVLKTAGDVLTYLGNSQEALEHVSVGLSLDPFDATFYIRRGWANFYSRRYTRAIEDAQNALLLAPERQIPHHLIGLSLQQLGKFAEAKVQYEKVPQDQLFRLADEAILAAKTGDSALARARMLGVHRMIGEAASYQFAQIHAQLGDERGAFAALEKAVEIKDAGLIYLKKDPLMDPIRPREQFTALLKRLAFPGAI